MSLKFSEPKSINIGNLKKIAIKTEDGKPVYVRKMSFLRSKERQEI